MHEFGVVMAVTRATRSASRKARRSEAVATGPFGTLSHDELGVIVDGLADPLQPVVAVALSSTCLGLRAPLLAALEVLKERHARAVALCRRLGMRCANLRVAKKLDGYKKDLTADDMATLSMLLPKWLPRLQQLDLGANRFGDAGVQVLCEGLGLCAALPSLIIIDLSNNNIRLAGAEAFAAALRRVALPKLAGVNLIGNPLGNQGVAALAAPLHQLPALQILYLTACAIGNEGVASLVANLGKNDFKELVWLCLQAVQGRILANKITDLGLATMVTALDAGGLPKLRVDHPETFLHGNPASDSAVKAVIAALAKRSQ